MSIKAKKYLIMLSKNKKPLIFFLSQKIIKFLRRNLFFLSFIHDKRKPISEVFGMDRGTPIDRFYISKFFNKYKYLLQGRVLEVGGDHYIEEFGKEISSYVVIRGENSNRIEKKADLTKYTTLKALGRFDCIIMVQVLNFIFDFQSALHNVNMILKKNGTVFLSVSGISQISKYDHDRWGDYWRFTDKSLVNLIEDNFPSSEYIIETYGNVFSSSAFLYGIAAEEMSEKDLMLVDENYQLLLCALIIKK